MHDISDFFKSRFKKKVSRIRKNTFYFQFCMETPEGLQKSIFSTSKMKKKTKNSYGIHPTEIAGSNQNPKKNYRNTKLNIK
jgi:hypothetical protein